VRYIWVRLWANGNKPPQITTIDDSNKSENKFLEWHLEGAFQSLDSFCLKPSWLLHRRLSALMRSAAGANDESYGAIFT
jgi:hypothetical protein